MDVYTALIAQFAQYGPVGLAFAVLLAALTYLVRRVFQLQDLRTEDAKAQTTALIHNTNATDELTRAEQARTLTAAELYRKVEAHGDKIIILDARISDLSGLVRDRLPAPRHRGAQ